MEATATCVAVGPDLHDRVWTGRRLILLGGQPAVITSTAPGYGDGAVYDPAKNRWRDIVPPKSPAGHLLAWQAGVQARGQVLAWSQWATSRRLGPNASTSRGGVELFTYGERTGRWRLVSQTPGELPAVEEVLRAGRQAVVRGLPYDCIGSFAPEETAVYDPDRNTWRRLPPDPLGGDHLVSTWTGAALFSFDSEGQYGPVRPGSASA